jgi:Tol biopolymer transport system component
MIKEIAMAKREAAEYQAKVTNDSGILRGKIPSPLVRNLGAREGDYIVFNSDQSGRVTVSLARSRGGAKRGGRGTKKGGKKR